MNFRRQQMLLFVLGLSLLAILCVHRLNAQVLYGSIVGTVSDQTGAVVPGAHVTVVNPLTGLKRETDTNTAGQYMIPIFPRALTI